jgi:peptidylprolyl isomerase
MKSLFAIAVAGMAAAPVVAAAAPAPSEIVAAAPTGDWAAIPATDLLVMDLPPDAQQHPRRVVIQLMPPPFSQGWIGNIRKLAAAHWWDGLAITRVQDNYVAQWGDGDAEDHAKAKPLPEGLSTVAERAYVTPQAGWAAAGKLPQQARDAYAPHTMLKHGWPLGFDRQGQWPVHCYGMVGVGRNLSPDTGSGAELYAVIGHAPRHLDRNIALVGRVIEGIEYLSSLPRGTGPLGVYETVAERVPIVSIRQGSAVAGLPAYQYLSTESASFARYADARANRRDPFFIRPAGGADICNIPVPVRRAP